MDKLVNCRSHFLVQGTKLQMHQKIKKSYLLTPTEPTDIELRNLPWKRFNLYTSSLKGKILI